MSEITKKYPTSLETDILGEGFTVADSLNLTPFNFYFDLYNSLPEYRKTSSLVIESNGTTTVY